MLWWDAVYPCFIQRVCSSLHQSHSVFLVFVSLRSLFLREAKWFWDCEFDSYTTKKGCSQYSASWSHLHFNTLLYKCLHKNIVLREILGSLKKISWSFALAVKHAKTDKRHSEAPNHYIIFKEKLILYLKVMTKAL